MPIQDIVVYVVFTNEGDLVVTRDLAEARKKVIELLNDFGFVSDLTGDLKDAADIQDSDLRAGEVTFEIDSGGDEHGNIFVERKVV